VVVGADDVSRAVWELGELIVVSCVYLFVICYFCCCFGVSIVGNGISGLRLEIGEGNGEGGNVDREKGGKKGKGEIASR